MRRARNNDELNRVELRTRRAPATAPANTRRTTRRTACKLDGENRRGILTFASGRDIISDVGERKFTSAHIPWVRRFVCGAGLPGQRAHSLKESHLAHRVRLLLSIAAACGGFAAPVLAGPTLPPLRAGGGWVTAQQTNLKKGETEPHSFSSKKTEGATTLGRRKKRHKQNKPPNRRAFPYKTAILYPLRVVYKTARAERSRFLYKIPVLYAKNSLAVGGGEVQTRRRGKVAATASVPPSVGSCVVRGSPYPESGGAAVRSYLINCTLFRQEAVN